MGAKENILTIEIEDGREALWKPIYLYTFLSVCLCPINVKTAEPIRATFFCGTSHDSREGLQMIKQISLKQILKIRELFHKTHVFLLFLFYNVCKQLK